MQMHEYDVTVTGAGRMTLPNKKTYRIAVTDTTGFGAAGWAAIDLAKKQPGPSDGITVQLIQYVGEVEMVEPERLETSK